MKKSILLFILIAFCTMFLFSCEDPNQETSKIKEIYNELFENVDFKNVESDLYFPRTYKETTIYYFSDNEKVLSNSGVVTRQDEDTYVTVNLIMNHETYGSLVENISVCVKAIVIDKNAELENEYNKVFGNIDFNNVTSDLNLPVSDGEFTFIYSSKNTNVLGNDGKITKQNEDTSVELSIIESHSKYGTKVFTETVIVKAKDGKTILEEYFDLVFDNIDCDNVTSDITLPTSLDGISFIYSSNNNAALDNTGKVTRGNDDVKVTMQIVLTHPTLGCFITKTVVFTVIKAESKLDPTKLASAYNKLFVGVDKTNVTSDLSFVSSIDGIDIEYTSNNTSVISNTGKVTRPVSDTVVTISIVLSHDDYGTLNKTVSFTVKGTGTTEQSTIKQVYDIASGTTLTVEGTIIAIMGYNYYISDGQYAVNLYKTKSCTSDTTSLKVGDYVTSSGTTNIYSGLYELNITSISKVSGKSKTITAKDVTDVSTLNDKYAQSMLINVLDCVLVSKPSSVSSSTDASYKVTVNGVETTVFVKKSISTMNSVFDDVEVGDTFDLENCLVGWHDAYQINVISGTSITVNSQGSQKLSTPVVTLNGSVASWAAVSNATSYVYKINNGQEVSTTSRSVTLSENDYIVVKAVGDGTTYSDSAWSNKVTYTVSAGEIVGLAAALAELDNFKYTLVVSWDYQEDDDYDDSVSVDYEYYDDSYYWMYDGYHYYLYFTNDDGTLIYEVEDDEYAYVLSSDEDNYYGWLEEGSFNYINLDGLNASDFELVGGKILVKDSKLSEIGKFIVGDYDGDTIESVELVLSNSHITQVIVTTTYLEEYDEETYHCDYTYTVTITSIGDVDFEIPNPTYTDEDLNDISEVYEMDDSESCIIGGNVTGFFDKYVFMSDETGSITLYFAKNSSVSIPSDLKIGDYIKVSGTKTTYSGLIQVKPTELEIVDEYFEIIEPTDISNVTDYINDVTKQGLIANLLNMEVTTVYTVSGSDATIGLTDGTNEFVLFIKSTLVSSMGSMFSGLKVGDKITLTSCALQWHNSMQFNVTPETEVQSANLTVNLQQAVVENGTTFEDALASINLVVKYYNESGEPTTLNSTDYTIDSSLYNKDVAGTYKITVTYNTESVSFNIKVKSAPIDAYLATDALRLDDVCEENDLIKGLPSTGDVNVLVIPVDFSNKTFETGYADKLNKAFNGTSEDTGWESLSSYYSKASYGKLNFTATITDVYHTNTKFNSSATSDSGLEVDYLKAALSYFDSTYDYSKYDNNDDGILDCVYLIYSAPYNSTDDDSLWWAFTYHCEEETNKYDTLGLGYYIFMSYDFLTDPMSDGTEEGTNDVTVAVNAETIIHETGHALGLDDYYDYDNTVGPDGGLGGSDMMDYNVGDHNSYSKSILGWTTPTVVVNKDYTATIGSFESTGDCIIVTKSSESESGLDLFNEYYIIDFYTPTGLNELMAGNKGMYTISGVRIYHVSAALKDSKDMEESYAVTLNDNSYTKNLLVKVIEADGDDAILDNYYTENSDLFVSGNTLTPKWYDGTSCGFTISVSAIDGNNSATISISFN